MNAGLQNPQRRALFGRLLDATTAKPARTELRRLSSFAPTTEGVLWTIVGDRPNNIYLAGDDGTVFHFDGEQWSRETSASQLPIHAMALHGEKLYSVGWLGQICVREHGQWRAVQGGRNETTRTNHPLFDLQAAPDGRLWAVGDHGRTACLNDDQWLELDSGTSAHLRAVLPLQDGRVLAGGLQGTALEYKGETWRTIDTGTNCAITSMAALEGGAVIAVGSEYSLDEQAFRGRVFLYQEAHWQTLDIDYPLPRLRRVRKEGDNIIIVGDGGAAFRWTADGVETLQTAFQYDLHDVLSFAPGEALVCGDGGIVLQETDQTDDSQRTVKSRNTGWSVISNGETNKTLRALWPIGEERLIAAGDGGTVIHIDGDHITECTTPTEHRIHDLWGSSPRNIFAAGDNGVVLHFDGRRWTAAHQSNSAAALLAITGFGPHDVFVVGDQGQALRYDGLMWRALETGCRQELYGLWGQDSEHLLAVGGGGTILRWNGQHWASFHAGTDLDLYAVHGNGLNRLFLAGLAGTAIRFEDNAWHKEFTGVRADLHAIHSAGNQLIVVGSNGTVLSYRGDCWQGEKSNCDNTLQAIARTQKSWYAVGSGGVVIKRSVHGH